MMMVAPQTVPQLVKRPLDPHDAPGEKRPKLEEHAATEEPAIDPSMASSSTSEPAADCIASSTVVEASSPAAAAPVAPVPAPAPPQEPDMNNLPQNPIPKHQQKHATTAIKAVKRLKDAKPFLQPVDPVALNIPLYFNKIKRPMDLSTIERKLAVNAYETVDQIVQDFNLMVKNCEDFNGPTSAISQMARNIQASFEKYMLNMPPKDIINNVKKTSTKSNSNNTNNNSADSSVVIRRTYNNGRPKREIHPPKSKDIYPVENKKPKSKKLQQAMKFCQSIVKELTSKKNSSFNYPFLEPVDPVALNLPTYFDYIKEPMDLGTISTKLSNWDYKSMEEFEHDVRLVFDNCYKFNPEGTIVNMMGHRLEDVFNDKWADRPIFDDYDSEEENYYDSDVISQDSDSDIDESSITNPAIQYLEEQLQRMKVELQQLKKQELDRIRKERRLARGKKYRNRKNSKKSHRGKKSSHFKTVVTYEMKKIITEKINDLPTSKLEKAIDIIKRSMPNIAEDDEVELDLDTLDNTTILTLYNTFFRHYETASSNNNNSSFTTNTPSSSLAAKSPLSPNSASTHTNGGKKRRSKVLTDEEQNKQIEKIKNKLAILDGASPLSQNGSPIGFQNGHSTVAHSSSASSSDDDDDDASSESEEE